MRIKKIIEVAVPVCIIVPFIIISFYNHPALDDWWYAEVYKEFGFLGAQEYWYTHYTGRFFSNFAMTLAPLSFTWIEGHKLLPVVFLGCLYSVFYYISNSFFKPFASRKYVLALWFTAGYLLIQRDYFESIYWLAANVVYQFTFLFLLLHFSFLYQVVVERKDGIWRQCLAIFLGVFITGSNETMGGLVLAAAFALLAYQVYRKKISVFVVLLCISQVISWVIMFAAPGNWAKISDATQEHIYTMSFWKSVQHSILSTGYYGVYLLRQPSVWCLVVILFPASHYLFTRSTNIINKRKWLILGSIISICISLLIYFISIYPTGIFIPPLRVTNIAIVFIFLFIMLATMLMVDKTSGFLRFLKFTSTYQSVIMLLCMAFAVFTPTKFRDLLKDITSGKAQAYNNEMFNRYALIKANKADTIILPKLNHIPRTIIATDVTGHVQQKMGIVFGKTQPVKTSN
jgi:hypothetical protein